MNVPAENERKKHPYNKEFWRYLAWEKVHSVSARLGVLVSTFTVLSPCHSCQLSSRPHRRVLHWWLFHLQSVDRKTVRKVTTGWKIILCR
jgi:hypothetical protein